MNRSINLTISQTLYLPPARSLARTCHTDTHCSGYPIGDHRRLALILYASGSVYDQQVQSDLANGKTVVAEEDPGMAYIENTTRNITANSLVDLFGSIVPFARRNAAASSELHPLGELDGGFARRDVDAG